MLQRSSMDEQIRLLHDQSSANWLGDQQAQLAGS